MSSGWVGPVLIRCHAGSFRVFHVYRIQGLESVSAHSGSNPCWLAHAKPAQGFALRSGASTPTSPSFPAPTSSASAPRLMQEGSPKPRILLQHDAALHELRGRPRAGRAGASRLRPHLHWPLLRGGSRLTGRGGLPAQAAATAEERAARGTANLASLWSARAPRPQAFKGEGPSSARGLKRPSCVLCSRHFQPVGCILNLAFF